MPCGNVKTNFPSTKLNALSFSLTPLAITNVRDEFKASLPREKYVGFGIEINPVNGRQMIQYNEDLVWSELKEKLQQREELLKVALKTNEPFYDSDG